MIMGFLANRRPQITLAVSRNLETQVAKGENDNEVTNTALAVWKHFLRNISRIRISYRKRKTQTGPAETRKLPKQC
jgi:hypothetical protein